MKYFRNYKGKLAWTAALTLLTVGLQILVPKIISGFIDSASEKEPMGVPILLIAGYVCAAAHWLLNLLLIKPRPRNKSQADIRNPLRYLALHLIAASQLVSRGMYPPLLMAFSHRSGGLS